MITDYSGKETTLNYTDYDPFDFKRGYQYLNITWDVSSKKIKYIPSGTLFGLSLKQR
jgi:hypothetical protein